ncbi:hypothetical protein R9X47_20175 [Wukongibacter baidiensis]|uniref:hypothetical protein n=1 Tax=Wukongibacter baidiensis TaxID=1723361 RepID=UPI003D7F584B
MENTYLRSHNYYNQVAKLCISIIETELELFFASCKKSAYAYSLMIAKDINDYNSESFERVVLSTEEIEAFIKRLVCKINIEMSRQVGYLSINEQSINMTENTKCNMILEETIESFRTTQKVTRTCEKIINTTLNKTFKSLCSNSAANYMFKKINFGAKIFGGNNYKSLINQHQEKIQKQIEGILINMKINIRNQLIEVVIESLNNTEMQKNYAIA